MTDFKDLVASQELRNKAPWIKIDPNGGPFIMRNDGAIFKRNSDSKFAIWQGYIFGLTSEVKQAEVPEDTKTPFFVTSDLTGDRLVGETATGFIRARIPYNYEFTSNAQTAQDALIIQDALTKAYEKAFNGSSWVERMITDGN